MIYQLTPEQIEKYKAESWKVVGISMVFIVGIMVVFTFPSFSRLDQILPQLLILWGITLFLVVIGMVSGVSRIRKKRVTQIETKSKSLILTSELRQEEIQGDSITQMAVTTGPTGNVELILLKTLQQPFVILRGYDQMDRLASDLEKAVADPAKVVRNQAKGGAAKRPLAALTLFGILGLILLVFGGFIWGLAKLGFGFLILPLCFVGMGASRFAGNRRNRNERMTGVVLIFVGILFAAFRVVEIYMNGG
ncbi:MAG TPA: hypothetical protein VJ873_05525, partial [bacterium]|nr:hypothetical protein [bacterium]